MINLAKDKETKIEKFFIGFPFVIYYVHFSCYLKDLWVQLDKKINLI